MSSFFKIVNLTPQIYFSTNGLEMGFDLMQLMKHLLLNLP